MLTDVEKQRIVHSWKLVEPIADTAAELFYGQLFRLDPSLRRLFPEDLTRQRKKLLASLAFVVRSLDWSANEWKTMIEEENDLFLVILALGRRHRTLYRVEDAHYAVVGAALIWTLEQGLGQAFNADVRRAWEKVYQLISTAMKLGKD